MTPTIQLNTVIAPFPCATCPGTAHPEGFAVVDIATKDFLCEGCIVEHAPDLGRLLAGWALDASTSDDAQATEMAWLRAFIDLGVLDPDDHDLATALVRDFSR